MRSYLPVLLALVVVPLASVAAPSDLSPSDKGVEKPAAESAKAPFTGERPAVDVAILLDTSNSMDGLISQAKSQIWTIVQQFADAKKNGKTPSLRVALFEYGNTGLPASEGYLRQVVPLSDDLDKLSEALFALKTNGGDEYCGQVIDEALKRLDWTDLDGSYKAIFIAGNEPFTQGPVDFRLACGKAIGSGVVVNTIHCGPNATGVSGHWAEAAELAEGEAFNIDQDRRVVQIKCPQDGVLLKLNVELNGTYLWYGAKRQRGEYARNQTAQDTNAASLGYSAAASRAMAKAGAAYSNVGRDLVDSYLADESSIKAVKTEELPDALQKMTPDERVEHVRQLAARRAELKQQIGKLSAEREAYLVAERAKRANTPGGETLGDAVTTAIGGQLKQAGFATE
ncbi:MAG: vWA domain-containing protein [Planctomycetota bacterium]